MDETTRILTKEEMREKALLLMRELDIYKPYIEAFKKHNIVTCFEHYAGFYATPDNNYEKLHNIIGEFEKEYGHLVYAATHEYLGDDEVYTLLYVPKYADDLEFIINETEVRNTYYISAYCYNCSFEHFSEFGDVVIHKALGGIRREG